MSKIEKMSDAQFARAMRQLTKKTRNTLRSRERANKRLLRELLTNAR